MTSRPFRFRWRTQTFRANLLDSLCDVLHTYGLDFGLHLRHLRDEYTRKEVGDYYAAMCPISHNILLRLEAVVNRWTKRVTRGLIGRVRSANICGGRKLHKYVSTNVWTMKNVSTQQMSRSVRYMTLQSGTVALRWLFSCWNKHGRLSRDQSPSGHIRSQAISCLAHRPYSRQATEQLPLSGSVHSHQLVYPKASNAASSENHWFLESSFYCTLSLYIAVLLLSAPSMHV